MADELTVTVRADVPAESWNATLAAARGSVFQTTYWASYLHAYLGATPYYLLVHEQGRPVAQLLLFETLRGQESALAGGRQRLRRLVTPLLKTLQWWQGPVLIQPERSPEALALCLEATDALGDRLRVTGVEEAHLPVGCETWQLASAFAAHSYDREGRATIVVDVSRSDEHAWQALKSEARTRVRKGQRHGVTVRRAESADDLRRFHDLVSDWRRRAGFPPYPPARHEELVRHLGAHCVVFLAEHNRVAAAGAGIWHLGEWGQVFTPVQAAEARDTGAGDVLFWELLRWSHERGLRTLDLAGIAPEPRSDKQRGIRRFKEKWGGGIVEYSVFTRVLRPARWRVAGSLRRLRRAARAQIHGA